LTVPNAPDLEFSTREHHAYLLGHNIDPRFANLLIREMKALMIEEWLLSLCGAKGQPLAETTKSSIRFAACGVRYGIFGNTGND
jgi:hypothetical protein